MAGSQTLLWHEVKHLWQEVKNSCISKITSKTSKASIKCFIFHHFSQKPLKRLYDNTFDVLLVIFEIRSNTLMAASQTLLWQQVKHSYGSKSNALMAIIYQQHRLAHLEECSNCVFKPLSGQTKD
jgi:hypothetical protein